MISKDRVVSLKYVLTSTEGEVLDRSEEGEPLEYLHGHQNIIPGLENALTNHQVGDKLKVEVAPEQGYGEYDEEKSFAIQRSHFGDAPIQEGFMVELTPDNGPPFHARITAIHDEVVEMDANHPMAGMQLHFDVEVLAIREATPDEIAHGHVHGPHGHHHH